MPRSAFAFAVLFSLAVHGAVLFVAVSHRPDPGARRLAKAPVEQVLRLEVVQLSPLQRPPLPAAIAGPPAAPVQQPTRPRALQPSPAPAARQPAPVQPAAPPAPTPTAEPPAAARASMDAPPAPSAEEWALAARYTLKNSKRYRHNWGQQVRSMMGTALQGPEQGAARFRVEIAPNGALARLDTIWSTSTAVEQRARAAV